MRGLLLTIMFLASAAALAATTVYTWVDAKGVTHYSDQPHPGAAKMQVENAPTFSDSRASQESAAAPESGSQARPACSIESPGNKQMLMNAWNVTGQVRLPSNVQPGDRVILLLDGKVLPGAADSSGAFTIGRVERGVHTLAAQVESASGRVICQAQAVTFYVHQPSQQAPNPANRPRF